MPIGGTTRSIAQTRAIRAQAGKTQNAQLSLLALDISPKTPTVNLEDEPDIHPLPLTGGDGAEVDESTTDAPFTEDSSGALVPEGVSETGGVPVGSSP